MDPAYLAEYEQFELNHWWHKVRRRIIESFLDRRVVAPAEGKPLRWLDVGCGTGVILNHYGKIADKMGVETDAHCVERAASKGLDVRQTGLSWDFSQFGTFDLVSLCDVLEHVEHDAPAVREIAAALNPGGKVLITVPALMSLWSGHDVVNHHYRRYRREQLVKLFDPAVWEIERATYFCTFLLPMIWTARKLKNWRDKRSGRPPSHDNRFGPKWLDKTLEWIFDAERPLLKRCSMPIGNSLLLIARKKG